LLGDLYYEHLVAVQLRDQVNSKDSLAEQITDDFDVELMKSKKLQEDITQNN